MEKEINFSIKKGVYCSWCAEMMKRTLQQRFAFKEIEIDFVKNKVHVIAYKRINPKKIISFLKNRGYYLSKE